MRFYVESHGVLQFLYPLSTFVTGWLLNLGKTKETHFALANQAES